MVEENEEVKKGTPIRSKARGLLPISKDGGSSGNKAYESNKQIYGDKLDSDSNRMSLNSSQ